jgi:glycosyltransferase involved in cell wall biosynthesis
MNAPEISVVIPCFNAEPYIAAAIESVLIQQEAELEVIVVDDGSSDNSAELVRRSFPQVQLLRQRNAGVAVARNTGIAQARGSWIAFLDADDVWLPGKLQAQRRLLESYPGARMAYGAWHVWSGSDARPTPALLAQLEREAADRVKWQGASGWIYPELLLDCVVWTSTVLAHRSLFDEGGVFDPELRIGEDYDLWLRLSRLTPILRVQAPLALYRMHPSSITKGVVDRNYKGAVVGRALQRWGYAAPNGRAASKAEVDRGLARSWSDFAGAHLVAGNTRTARSAALTALRVSPGHLLAWKVLLKSWLPGAARAADGVAT